MSRLPEGQAVGEESNGCSAGGQRAYKKSVWKVAGRRLHVSRSSRTSEQGGRVQFISKATESCRQNDSGAAVGYSRSAVRNTGGGLVS